MKLVEAQKVVSNQLNTLRAHREKLTSLLEKPPVNSNFDRLELTKELEAVEKACSLTEKERDRLSDMRAAIHDAESARQENEANAEYMENVAKCLEIFRRIANGDKVPPADEKKLMDYNSEMYMSAKSMAVMHMGKEGKEYDSLWGDEDENKEEEPSPSEVAQNTEIQMAMPEMPAMTALE